LAIPSIRRASPPNPNDFGASKTVESAIPNPLNHAQQSIKKGQHGVASFPINGASGRVEIFDDIPLPLPFRYSASHYSRTLHFDARSHYSSLVLTLLLG
jgi:hypothetical protein